MLFKRCFRSSLSAGLLSKKLSSQTSVKLVRPEFIEISGEKYKTDDWTNVTSKIQSLTTRFLYKSPTNPIRLISDNVKNFFSDYDLFEFPSPVVPLWKNFDALLIPADHPSRSRSDTYYVNEEYVLRCHTSAHQAECLNTGSQAFVCIADVYRRDTIDAFHFPAFHQCEILKAYTASQLNLPSVLDAENKSRSDSCQELYSNEASTSVEKELKSALEDYIRHLLGPNVPMRWVPAYFPFTHPSFELEINHGGEWVEILGCGVMESKILLNSGIVDKIAWAAGFGLERLAMIKYGIPDIRLFWTVDPGFHNQFRNIGPTDAVKYEPPISNHPALRRDISFWLPDGLDWSPNDFYDLVSSAGKNLVESVTLIDDYVNKEGRRSNAFRIIYRSPERAMTGVEANEIHEAISFQAIIQLGVDLR